MTAVRDMTNGKFLMHKLSILVILLVALIIQLFYMQ